LIAAAEEQILSQPAATLHPAYIHCTVSCGWDSISNSPSFGTWRACCF